MKLFEEFMNDAYEMQSILDKLQKRIDYWFQNGEFSMRSNQLSMEPSKSPTSSKKSIITNFADSDFYYQLIVRMNIEDLEHCEVILKKYDPAQIDSYGGGKPVGVVELTNDKRVKVNDVKEDFIIKKLSEMDDEDQDPDKNKIETPKEPAPPQPETPPQQPPPPGAQAPVAQGAGGPMPQGMGAPPQGMPSEIAPGGEIPL